MIYDIIRGMTEKPLSVSQSLSLCVGLVTNRDLLSIRVSNWGGETSRRVGKKKTIVMESI